MQSTKTELEESLDQFVTTWRLLARPFPQADLSDKPGLAVSWPSTDFPFYNIVFLTEELKDEDAFRDRVRGAATHLRTSKTPGLFLVCLDRLSGGAENNFATILGQEGLVPAIPMTGMAGDILPLAGTPHPDLHFVRISDDDTIRIRGDQLRGLRYPCRNCPLLSPRTHALEGACLWLPRLRW